MKRLIPFLILFLVFLPLMASQANLGNLLATAEDVAASGTATNGVEFNSEEIRIARGDFEPSGIFTIEFTRAAGGAETLDFSFEGCYDNKVTWATLNASTLEVATNTAPVTGTTVRVSFTFEWPGVRYVRLKSIENNDTANNVTACNVNVSIHTK